MIPLPPKFRARGFDWRIIQREGEVAIIEQNRKGWTHPVLNIVIVQKHKARRLPNGEMTVNSEGIPSWEQWGDKAWTCVDKADAKARFNKLVDAANASPCQYVVGKQPPYSLKGVQRIARAISGGRIDNNESPETP